MTVSPPAERDVPARTPSGRGRLVTGLMIGLRRGYYVMGEDFVIDIKQLRHPDSVEVTPIKRTETRLAAAVDGTATPYDCGKG